MALTECKIPLKWPGIFSLLSARFEDEQIREYAYDLVWLLAKARYENIDTPMPSTIRRKNHVKHDERTKEQIISDLIKKL